MVSASSSWGAVLLPRLGDNGDSGMGKTTPGRWQNLSHPVRWRHEPPFFPGTGVGLLGWQGCAGGYWGWLRSTKSKQDSRQGVKGG